MGRMRQMSIERVDAVDEPATGARWIIAKRSGQAETPTVEELAKSALEALHKDAELNISEEAGEALSALAAVVELEFELEKAEESEGEESSEGEAEGEAEAADEAAADEAAEGEESEEAEGDEGESEGEESEGEAEGEESESGEDGSVEKRLETIERALEILLEKADSEPEAESTQKSRRRTSKQAKGQDDLAGDTRKLSKSGKGEGERERVSYADVLFNQ